LYEAIKKKKITLLYKRQSGGWRCISASWGLARQ